MSKKMIRKTKIDKFIQILIKELFGDMTFISGCNFMADYEKFCINNVNGQVSILFKKLLEYIN